MRTVFSYHITSYSAQFTLARRSYAPFPSFPGALISVINIANYRLENTIETMGKINFSRKELYKLVWTKPASILAKELGTSDVWIGKLCNSLNIPKPSRGYWARLAAGQKPPKKPLPKLEKSELLKEMLNIIPSSQDEESNIFSEIQTLDHLVLPKRNKELHPKAAALLTTLQSKEESSTQENRVWIHDNPEFPNVLISKNTIVPVVYSFHAIIKELENRGIDFKNYRGRSSSGRFESGNDHIQIAIEEPIITIHRQPTEKEKRLPSWEWKLTSRKPSGYLEFEIGNNDYYNRKKSLCIAQGEDESLESVSAAVVEAIWSLFMQYRKERIEEHERAVQHEKEREIEIIKEEEEDRKRMIIEKRKAHTNRLKVLEESRNINFLNAVFYRGIVNSKEFISECESNWKSTQGKLTAAQKFWLRWTKKFSKTLRKIKLDYPDPESDGGFDINKIQLGGPYPAIRKIPLHPNMPVPKAPKETPKPEVQYYYEKSPYPFWLKHQH